MTLDQQKQFWLDAQLCEAVCNENIEEVKRLIENGANVNARSHSYTPLMFCALYPNSKMAELLINAGANIEALDEDGENALIIAVNNYKVKETDEDKIIAFIHTVTQSIGKQYFAGDTSRIEFARDYAGVNFLMRATENHFNKLLYSLAVSNVNYNVNMQDDDGLNALMYAIDNVNLGAVKLLVGMPRLDILQKDYLGRSALDHAQMTYDNLGYEAFEENPVADLMRENIKLVQNRLDKELCDAAYFADLEQATECIKQGANVFARDENGCTALDNAKNCFSNENKHKRVSIIEFFEKVSEIQQEVKASYRRKQ